MSKYKATVSLAEEPHKDYLGTAIIEIAGAAAIKNVIIQGSRGDTIKLKFPSDELGGTDVVYPVSAQARRAMTAAVAAAYKAAVEASDNYAGLPDTEATDVLVGEADSPEPPPPSSETALWGEYKAVADRLGGVVMFYRRGKGLKTIPIVPTKQISEHPSVINLLAAKLLKEGYSVAIRTPDGKLIEYDKVKKPLREVLRENTARANQPVSASGSDSSGRAVSVKWAEQLKKGGA